MSAAEIRLRSERLRRGLTVLFIVLAVLLMLERFSVPLIHVWRGESDAWRHLAVAAAAVIPDGFYLAALWGVRTALAGFAKGDFFAPTIAGMLDRVGRWLAIGAIISVFVVPLADTLIGFGPGYLIAFDVSGLVLGAVGLSLTIVSRVLARAAKLQTELDEIF